MPLFQLIVIIIIVIAVLAVLGWFLRKSGTTIPYPLMIVFYAVCAIVVIGFLLSLAGMGPWAVRW